MANRNESEEQSNRPACAACKYQRKKCMADCILRRHFPADRAEGFKAVHKIFGIANVTKMIREVSLQERDEVAKSLLWEADMWVQDPVRGPYGCFERLQKELEELKAYINKNQLLQGISMPMMPVMNKSHPWQINSSIFHGNTMNVNSNGKGNSRREFDVNGYNSLVQGNQVRGGNLPYQFHAVGPVNQRLGLQGQEVEPTFMEQQGNGRPYLLPAVRNVGGIGAEQVNNRVIGHQSILNTRHGSRVSAHFLGSESNSGGSSNRNSNPTDDSEEM